MAQVKFEDLLGTGAHFGHVTRKWDPNFKPYILLEKNGVHIINLESTIESIEKACDFVKDIVGKNGEILFVGTKKQAQDIVQQEADRCSMFYIVERWLGGTLTNFSTIKKSIKRLKMLEKEGSNLYENMTKKETQMLNREKVKLADQHRGIKDMRRLPDALVIVDAQYEDTAIREAGRLEIPVIAIVDSNTNPNKVDYPIPANDDSMRTIQLIISAIADTIVETKGQSSKQDDIENNALKNEENKNKKSSTSQNVSQANGKSTPDIESDDLTKEEE
jgi:small subunit ribosomal protein S2